MIDTTITCRVSFLYPTYIFSLDNPLIRNIKQVEFACISKEVTDATTKCIKVYTVYKGAYSLFHRWNVSFDVIDVRCSELNYGSR